MDTIHNNNHNNGSQSNNNNDNSNNNNAATIMNNNNKFSSYEQNCINYIESIVPANLILDKNNSIDSDCNNYHRDIDDDIDDIRDDDNDDADIDDDDDEDNDNNNDNDDDDEERLNYERKLWNYFQSSAMAIAQLYSRDNLLTANNVWNTFQQASTSVTCLYKESSDYHRKNYDRYRKIGYHKRTKELLNWLKKRKNTIKREDLLTFLCGYGYGHQQQHNFINNNNNNHRNTLHSPYSSLHHRSNRSNNNNNSNSFRSYRSPNTNNIMNRLDLATKLTLSSNDLDNNNNNNSNNDDNNNIEPNLETFKEALNVRSNNNNNNQLSPTSTITNQTLQQQHQQQQQKRNNLHEFVDQQFKRHSSNDLSSRKRTSSMDICMMDSTGFNNNKRTKFY